MEPQTTSPDIRAVISQLQQSGEFGKLSTAQLEQLLTQLRGQPVTAKAMPNGAGLSFQSEDGRQIIGNPDPAAKTSGEERATIAEIFSAMRNR